MTSEVFGNSPVPGRVAAVATLAGNGGQVSAVATSVIVASALPLALQSGGQFHALVDSELVVIPCQSGLTLSGVSRGVEGSTAAVHLDGALVFPLLTAGAIANALAGTLASASATAAADVGVETSRAEGVEGAEQARALAAEALLAPKASPALTGAPTAPTQTPLDASTKLATTAYGDAAVAVEKARALTAEALAEVLSHKDVANGYAGLDSGGLLKTSELPVSVVGASLLPASAGQVPQSAGSTTNAVTWAAAANSELGYAEITADTQVTGTTVTDVTGLSTAVTVGSRPIMVELFCPVATCSIVNAASFWQILEDGVVIAKTERDGVASVVYGPLILKRRRAPSAGAHTYKVQYFSSTAGATAEMFVTGFGAAYISVVQL